MRLVGDAALLFVVRALAGIGPPLPREAGQRTSVPLALRRRRGYSSSGSKGFNDLVDSHDQAGTKFATEIGVRLEYLASLLPILVIFVIIILLKGFLRRASAPEPSYERKGLFSAAERSLLGVLEQILGKEYRIIGKVRIADIIRPRQGLSAKARTSALNRITSKHVDFALCDPRTLEVVGVIELDDSSHCEPRRRRRDELVDAALSSAGVPIARIPAQRAYTPAEIRLRLSGLLAPATII
jgi:hypothetical protein